MSRIVGAIITDAFTPRTYPKSISNGTNTSASTSMRAPVGEQWNKKNKREEGELKEQVNKSEREEGEGGDRSETELPAGLTPRKGHRLAKGEKENKENSSHSISLSLVPDCGSGSSVLSSGGSASKRDGTRSSSSAQKNITKSSTINNSTSTTPKTSSKNKRREEGSEDASISIGGQLMASCDLNSNSVNYNSDGEKNTDPKTPDCSRPGEPSPRRSNLRHRGTREKD